MSKEDKVISIIKKRIGEVANGTLFFKRFRKTGKGKKPTAAVCRKAGNI